MERKKASIGSKISEKNSKRTNLGSLECETRKEKNQQAPSSLPKSLRNAPLELRGAIRRQQKIDESQRKRNRDRANIEKMFTNIGHNEKRLSDLQKEVDRLADEIAEISPGSQSRLDNSKKE